VRRLSQRSKLQFDKIGYWSEIKLDIVKNYAAPYSKILASRRNPNLFHVYIDAFAGAGTHISRTTEKFVPGSPRNALEIEPPFREYHFIDLNPNKVNHLRDIVGQRSDVLIYEGDCNSILLQDVFPRVQYKDYRRGLCLLDPYGLHLRWEVIETASRMGTIDMFLNFPIADMNRNVLWHNPEGVEAADIERMNAFWGDDSWRKIAYTTDGSLFGYEEKTTNEAIAEGFRDRLRKVAGFKHVPKPMPMRNSNSAIVYYLFFASQQRVAMAILEGIFKKYRNRGAR
jgi:three-Cys-motif partner protein